MREAAGAAGSESPRAQTEGAQTEGAQDRIEERIRQREIDSYGVLGQQPARDLQALVELAAQVCEVRGAAICLITEAETHHVAAVGLEPATCPREDSLCGRVFHESQPVLIPDMLEDPRFVDHPLVNGQVSTVRFYANVRLVTSAGVPIGTLCVADFEPRTMSYEQHGALQTLADRVVDVLELRLRARQLEQALRDLAEARDELHRSNEQLAIFAGQVSNDLLTPLIGVLGYTEMLAERPLVAKDERASWLAERALSSGERMHDMLEELVAYAQVGEGHGYVDVDLTRLADEVRTDLSTALASARAELMFDTLPTVRGDQAQLRAVLSNLIGNATKFARPGVFPEISVAARRVGVRWRVEVSDNGVGIPVHRRSEVFGLLARSGVTPAEGSGIGLTTCKRIIEAHGGEIGLGVSPAGGALVWFELPG